MAIEKLKAKLILNEKIEAKPKAENQEINKDIDQERDIKSYIPLSQNDILIIVEHGLIRKARFEGIDVEAKNGLFLIVDFVDYDGEIKEGFYAKVDGTPRLILTPNSIIKTAGSLGIEVYIVDTRQWKADYYDLYAAQSKRAKEKSVKGSRAKN